VAVVEGAGGALSVLQAGNVAKIEQTKSFFSATMTYFLLAEPASKRIRLQRQRAL
jgi:hypothetical protein